MKVSNTTLVKLGRMCRFAFALAILLRCDAAMAGKFFFDDFEDGNYMDASPVSWQASSAIDMSDGELQFTTTSNANVSADSLDSDYRDGIFRTQLSWNAFGSSRAYAGLYVRGAENGRSIWAGMWPGGDFGMGRSGPGLFTVLGWQANSGLDPFDGYVNLELAVKGTRFSMTAWQEGQTRPSRPQFTFSDSNFSVGTVGLSADSNSNSMTNVGFSYFQALPYLSGDFSDSGTLDVADVDAIVGEIVMGTNNGAFDINGDGALDPDDVAQWLSDAAAHNGFDQDYLAGDSNLDGSVNATDLNNLALNWQQNVGLWSGGDFTADGSVNAADLNALALNWRNSISMASPTAAAVPEPSAACLVAFAALGLLGSRRRRPVS